MRSVLAIAVFVTSALLCSAQEPALPQVSLNTDHVAGRQLEELTVQGLTRDYAKAWHTLATALDENRSDIVDNDFVGVEANKLTAAVKQQARAGLHRRYVDRGHDVDVLFYSPDGASVQLRDTARLEVQYMDGNKVLHTENATRSYIALMTPTAVRWKVRVLQQVEK